jgi:Ser/Thr protein kinase RdoA (MazF antagonist)
VKRARETGDDAAAHPYSRLAPELVLAAVDRIGYASDGRLLALNSFENRVYQVGIEGGTFVVAKFYRPGRWSDAAIREEHAFALELAEAELPVLAPIARAGETLFEYERFRYALFPRMGGRAPELEGTDTAQWLGRTLARLHAVGARAPFRARARLDRAAMVEAPSRAVLRSALLPAHVKARYEAAIAAALAHSQAWDALAGASALRLHGDCHPGNVLWREAQGPLLVDFDDCRTGPAVQDLWMLLTGAEMQRDALLEGYGEFRDFDPRELALIPLLRLMRQIHYAGWIAERWSDPAFPRTFPFAAEPTWWERHVRDLGEAVAELEPG